LESGVVDVLLISEGVDRLRVFVECSSCGASEEKSVELANFTEFETRLTSSLCQKCNNSSLTVKSQKSLIEEFGDLAEKTGSQLEIISSETEEGIQLLKGFGGIVAILRYSFG